MAEIRRGRQHENGPLEPAQCPVPAMPEPPVLLVNPELMWMPAQLAAWERELDKALGKPGPWIYRQQTAPREGM